jgi:hypothetical protein
MTATPSTGVVDVPHLVMENVNTIDAAEPDGEKKSRKTEGELVTGARIRTKPKQWKDW